MMDLFFFLLCYVSNCVIYKSRVYFLSKYEFFNEVINKFINSIYYKKKTEVKLKFVNE